MSNDLQIFEDQLKPLLPKFQQVLGCTMPVERLMRTAVVSCERNPELLRCDRQTMFNACMTFAVLGLEVDGVTGQGFLVPFKGRVQPIIGYLGYNTLAARAGMTVSGRVVRDGDGFDFDEATGVVHHARKLGGETGQGKRRIIAAWARAAAGDRPPVVRVLSLDELLAVRAASPRGAKPPWADPEIGFPAMCEKTAKRRLRRDMPLNVYQMAAAMEEAHEERGLHSWINPSSGVMVDTGDVIVPNYNDATPTAARLTGCIVLHKEAEMAAERGTEALNAFWRRIKPADRALLRARKHEGGPYMDYLKTVTEKADKEQSENDETT